MKKVLKKDKNNMENSFSNKKLINSNFSNNQPKKTGRVDFRYFRYLTTIEKIGFIVNMIIFYLLIIFAAVGLYVILKSSKLLDYIDLLVLFIPVFIALFVFLPIIFKIRLRGEKRMLEVEVNCDVEKKEAKKNIGNIEASFDEFLSHRSALTKELINLLVLSVIAALFPLLLIIFLYFLLS